MLYVATCEFWARPLTEGFSDKSLFVGCDAEALLHAALSIEAYFQNHSVTTGFELSGWISKVFSINYEINIYKYLKPAGNEVPWMRFKSLNVFVLFASSRYLTDFLYTNWDSSFPHPIAWL